MLTISGMIKSCPLPENCRTVGEWMRFANSLRLRLAIRIAMADPDKARDEAHKSLTHPAGLLEEAYELAKRIHSPNVLQFSGIIIS